MSAQEQSPKAQTAPKAVNAESADAALPKMPPGAGKVDEDAPKQFQSTGTGLKYRVLRKGSDKKPKATSQVEVHYHGWLDNGNVFDSSYERKQTISFPLSDVIPGWTEGMQLVGEGGMIELVIPGNLAYGPRGRPGIPPNATLHFLVELKAIK